MKKHIDSIKLLFSEYFNKIVLFFTVISSLYFIIGADSILTNMSFLVKNVDKEIEMLIKEHNINEEAVIKYTCKFVNCVEVIEEKDINLFEVKSIFADTTLGLYYKQDDRFYKIDTYEMWYNLFYYYIIIVLPFIFIFIMILYVSLSQEKANSMTLLMSNEAILANKSMILITENIHHELNTPMEVIDNKVHKIKDTLMPHIDMFDIDAEEKEDLKTDFNFIAESADQIYAVLERMRDFKHIRYSNGNKSIRDSLVGAFHMISISNSNFTYDVDKSLAKYSLRGEKLKNADLLNIILNHLKNSLEANATSIFILIEEYDEQFVYFRIIDNGNGINVDNIKKIFEPNFSTKDEAGSIRGNGLYLNKSILNSVGGDVTLVNSTKYGTTFELKVPAKPMEQLFTTI